MPALMPLRPARETRLARLARLLGVLVLALFLTLPAVLTLPGAASAEGFVAGFEDLPLMPGLGNDPESVVVFDKQDGRIVSASASGVVGPAAVLDFYRETLPQLGWNEQAEGVYAREGERLTIAVAPVDGAPRTLRVRFELRPR